jgi:hypothetical protein
VTYTLKDLITIIPRYSSLNFYFFTRYGVGAWFWKPILIKHALKKIDPQYLIYVDSDCVFNVSPEKIIESALGDYDMAFFSQNLPLEGWISRRASRILELKGDELTKSSLITAGVAIMRNTEISASYLQTWENAMRNPRALLHPILNSSGSQHRHDQSILSALIAKGEINCNLIRRGFFSLGVESTSEFLKDSWIHTGDLSPAETRLGILQRVPLYLDHYSRKYYDLVKTLIIFPLQVQYHFLEKVIRKTKHADAS